MVWFDGSLSCGWLWCGCVVVAGTGGMTLPRNELLLSRVLDLNTPFFLPRNMPLLGAHQSRRLLLLKGRLVSLLFTLVFRMLLFSAFRY